MTLRSLHRDLLRRPAPEEVGQSIIRLLGLTGTDAGIFPTRPSWWRGSSMSSDWPPVAGFDKPLASLGALTSTSPPKGDDPDAIALYLAELRVSLGIQGSSFKKDRLNRSARRMQGLGAMSRRRYDKLFRLLARVDGYVVEYREQTALAILGRVAKIGLVERLSYRDFAASPYSAAFVAYYTANLARRSLFLVGPQARAFDQAAERLLALAAEAQPPVPKAGWYAIAHVFPRWDVLSRLSLEQRATLLEDAHLLLTEIAERLRIIADASSGIDLTQMVVHRGDDSSTWNALAGAWNKARDLWIACAYSLDPTLLDAYLPGKVLRLMAADVARWHQASGGGLDPDTRIWASLPRPWVVLSGEARCGASEVVAACRAEGTDPGKTGWVAPRPRSTVSEVVATPESVHGVIAAHPDLAALLRKAGWFSGKSARPIGVSVTVQRDADGFVVGAE